MDLLMSFKCSTPQYCSKHHGPINHLYNQFQVQSTALRKQIQVSNQCQEQRNTTRKAKPSG